jgi:hypothetical protein
MTLLGVGPKGSPAKNDYRRPIRDLPIAAIDTTLVIKVLSRLSLRKPSKPDSPHAADGRTEFFFSRCPNRHTFTNLSFR